jgi:hypothetical protein
MLPPGRCSYGRQKMSDTVDFSAILDHAELAVIE